MDVGSGARSRLSLLNCSVLNAAAASAYRFALLLTSLVGGLALARIPILGLAASVIFLCWIDSFYICESVWIARGMSLAVRVKYLEERWTYFLAFGECSRLQLRIWHQMLTDNAYRSSYHIELCIHAATPEHGRICAVSPIRASSLRCARLAY